MHFVICLLNEYWLIDWLPITVNWTFSLGATGEALRANIDWKLAFSLQQGHLLQNFRKRSPPTNHSSYQKTRIHDLLCGIRMWVQVSFLTDRQEGVGNTVRCITCSRTVMNHSTKYNVVITEAKRVLFTYNEWKIHLFKTWIVPGITLRRRTSRLPSLPWCLITFVPCRIPETDSKPSATWMQITYIKLSVKVSKYFFIIQMTNALALHHNKKKKKYMICTKHTQ